MISQFFATFRSPKSHQTVSTLIKFCLDINCNTADDSVFPKNICETCLEKLEVSFDLKTNAQESDKYLKQILFNTGECDDEQVITPYEPPPYCQQSYDQGSNEDDLLQPLGNYFEPDTDLKGIRGKEYSCTVCNKTFRYEKPFLNHLKLHKPFETTSSADYDEPEEVASDDGDLLKEESDDDPEYFKKGERLGKFVCECGKTFKYMKPFRNHLKLVGHEDSAKTRNKRRDSKRPKLEGSSSNQPPYDSVSPYSSPVRYKPTISQSSSPDLGLMMINSNVIDSPEPEKRKRKQKFPSRSPSKELDLEILETRKRSRGRPRKSQNLRENDNVSVTSSISSPSTEQTTRQRGRPRKTLEHPEESKEDKSDFAEFSEVDVNSMLKANPISFTADDSQSAASVNSNINRSRSPSVEVVQEFDIFGSPNKVLPSTPKAKPISGSGSFACDVLGCSKKFHLKANLKKHHREQHSDN